MKASIIPEDGADRCYICRTEGPTEVHHMIHGTAGRSLADYYGLTCHLCPMCHRLLHDKGTFDRELQAKAQEAWEDKYIRDQTHDIVQGMIIRVRQACKDAETEWMRIFGKNYQ